MHLKYILFTVIFTLLKSSTTTTTTEKVEILTAEYVTGYEDYTENNGNVIETMIGNKTISQLMQDQTDAIKKIIAQQHNLGGSSLYNYPKIAVNADRSHEKVGNQQEIEKTQKEKVQTQEEIVKSQEIAKTQEEIVKTQKEIAKTQEEISKTQKERVKVEDTNQKLEVNEKHQPINKKDDFKEEKSETIYDLKVKCQQLSKLLEESLRTTTTRTTLPSTTTINQRSTQETSPMTSENPPPLNRRTQEDFSHKFGSPLNSNTNFGGSQDKSNFDNQKFSNSGPQIPGFQEKSVLNSGSQISNQNLGTPINSQNIGTPFIKFPQNFESETQTKPSPNFGYPITDFGHPIASNKGHPWQQMRGNYFIYNPYNIHGFKHHHHHHKHASERIESSASELEEDILPVPVTDKMSGKVFNETSNRLHEKIITVMPEKTSPITEKTSPVPEKTTLQPSNKLPEKVQTLPTPLKPITPPKLKYVKLEPLVLQKAHSPNGLPFFYWYRVLQTNQNFIQIPDTPENQNVHLVAQPYHPKDGSPKIPLPDNYRYFMDPDTGAINQVIPVTTTTTTMKPTTLSTTKPPSPSYSISQPSLLVPPLLASSLSSQNQNQNKPLQKPQNAIIPEKDTIFRNSQLQHDKNKKPLSNESPTDITEEPIIVPSYTIQITQKKNNNIKDNNIKDNNIKDDDVKDNNVKGNNVKNNNVQSNNAQSNNVNSNNVKQEFRFVIPLLITGGVEEVYNTSWPKNEDPFAYYPKELRSKVVHVSVPLKTLNQNRNEP